jgi:hypothetical protein
MSLVHYLAPGGFVAFSRGLMPSRETCISSKKISRLLTRASSRHLEELGNMPKIVSLNISLEIQNNKRKKLSFLFREKCKTR